MKKIYIGGTFDLLHSGHINLFRVAKKIADYVVVALNSDEFILEYKGKLPIIDYRGRKEMIESCRYVDEVVENIGGYDSKPAIERVAPDFLLHGDDWTGDAYLKQLGLDQQWLNERNITLLYTPYTEGISTTQIKQKISNY